MGMMMSLQATTCLTESRTAGRRQVPPYRSLSGRRVLVYRGLLEDEER